MSDFQTIHLFANLPFAQIIGKGFNKQVPYSAITKADAVIANIKALKPEDKPAADQKMINIFEEIAQYRAGKDASYQVKVADLNAEALAALVAELLAYEA